MPLTHWLFAVGLAGLGALLSGCGNTVHALNTPSDQVGSPGDGKAGKDGKDKEKDQLSRAAEVAQKERELEHARLSLEIATLKTAHDVAAAESEAKEASRSLVDAKLALANLARQAQADLEDAEIDRDEASNRADEAKAELAELEAMYQADEFAAMTKELVLQRGRRQLEFANRRLALQQKKLVLLREVEQEEKQREASAKVETATTADTKARQDLERIAKEAHLEQLKAKHAVLDAEEAVRKAKAEAQ